MEYLVNFEDGGSVYLAHSGVKGMKWGVWNEETKRRKVAQKKQLQKEERQQAAKSAAVSAGITAITTGGNPAAVSASFATAYASQRIAQQAVKKGKPVINKLVKDKELRPIANEAARRTTAFVIDAGLDQAVPLIFHSDRERERIVDYHITFDDGSSAYLTHYGVKGMKWKKHLKATDPEYLAQLGQNVQGFLGQASENISGTISGAKDALDKAGKKLNEAKFRVGAELRYKMKPEHVWKKTTIDTDGMGARSYNATLKNGRKRSWHEYTANGGKSFHSDAYWLDKLNKDRKMGRYKDPNAKGYYEHEREKTQKTGKQKTETPTARESVKKDFDRIDKETSAKKKSIDQKKTDPISYKTATKIADKNKGDPRKSSSDMAKVVYDNTAGKTVDKAKAEASSTYKKYKSVTERSSEMTESEKNALRKEARKKKNEQKRQGANQVRRLLGLPEK